MRSPRRRPTAQAAALVVGLGLLVATVTAGPSAGAATTRDAAPPGTNLLVNGDAELGDPSLSGYDAVTVPGWQVRQGLPTVAQYGEKGFPGRTAPGPADRGTNLFAGGAGGTSILTQTVTLSSPAPHGSTFALSGWLGGKGRLTDDARVLLTFRDAHGSKTEAAQLGPVTPADRDDVTELLERSTTGSVPPGTATVDVALVLTTTNDRYDTHDSSVVGFDRGFADDLSLTLSVPADAPVAAPPQSTVPRVDHVFFTIMENQNYDSVIGNARKAPFFNSLLPEGALLSDFFAEAHWSDPNYLAFSGGSAFGVLHDPLEGKPWYTIDARNLGDLVEAAGETWKAYAQSAHGPCDDTDHGYYYDDDTPFLYYRDIKDDIARCDAHVVAWPEFRSDLRAAATTPNFVWFGPNDFSDMEGGGIKAGDTFLRTTVTRILRSPAWTTQRSLLIITFDEDQGKGERPAQLVPTIVLGSQGLVKRGYVSTDRYTHYSLLRTVEGALGLGTLTTNDLYADPPNDVFAH
jgi:hypothetical protein